MIPWTVAHQAPLFVEFSREEYWSGLPFPSPGDLPNPWTEPGLLPDPGIEPRSPEHCMQILYWLSCEGKPRLISMVTAKHWGSYSFFFLIWYKLSLLHWLTLPSWNGISVVCHAALIAFYPRQNIFQKWKLSFQTLPLLYRLSICNTLNPLLSSTNFTTSSPGFRLKNPLSWLLHLKQPLIH